MCSSASRWAARAPWAESSSATVRAVAGERPLASYSPVSSVNSVSGESASSRFSCAICARSLSRWLETETYSPSAIDTAPPTRPASPAVKMGPRADAAPETPMTMAATDTIPSVALTPRPAASSATRRHQNAAPSGESAARPRPPQPEPPRASRRQPSSLERCGLRLRIAQAQLEVLHHIVVEQHPSPRPRGERELLAGDGSLRVGCWLAERAQRREALWLSCFSWTSQRTA